MKSFLKNILAYWIGMKSKTVSWLLEKPAALRDLNISPPKDIECEGEESSSTDEKCCLYEDWNCETVCDCYETRRWNILEATAIAIIVVTFLAIVLSFIF